MTMLKAIVSTLFSIFAFVLLTSLLLLKNSAIALFHATIELFRRMKTDFNTFFKKSNRKSRKAAG